MRIWLHPRCFVDQQDAGTNRKMQPLVCCRYSKQPASPKTEPVCDVLITKSRFSLQSRIPWNRSCFKLFRFFLGWPSPGFLGAISLDQGDVGRLRTQHEIFRKRGPSDLRHSGVCTDGALVSSPGNTNSSRISTTANVVANEFQLHQRALHRLEWKKIRYTFPLMTLLGNSQAIWRTFGISYVR